MSTSVLTGSETVRLYGWTDWPEAAGPVRAKLFGEMVKRAGSVIVEYHGDLYHDAQWINENVNGPCEFLWMPRHSGTHIGPLAEMWERQSSAEPRTLYHVAVTVDGRGQWFATFTTLVDVDGSPDGRCTCTPLDTGGCESERCTHVLTQDHVTR